MRRAGVVGLTALAMVAFAGNSLLCRQALGHTGMDAASFTVLRLGAGAALLGVLVRGRGGPATGGGNWPSALALFAYAAGFSFAYRILPAATGTLLLFGAVQATMIGTGLWRGERLGPWQWIGLAAACGGLVVLLLPGLAAPPLGPALLMLGAGAAWGIYSMRGRGAGDPTRVSAGNFARATLPALLLCLAMGPRIRFDPAGLGYALASGALASGCGYAIWYTALRGLSATAAATVQLSVPVLVTLGGLAFLGEPVTARLLISSLAVLGGLALVFRSRR